METNISINKIVSILIAIIVASCVLIPICNELGSNGNGGGESRSSGGNGLIQTLAYFDNYDYTYITDESTSDYYDWVVKADSGYGWNLRFVPGQDGLTYTEGEIVAVISDGIIITYTQGKLHIDKVGMNEDGDHDVDLDCAGIVLGRVQTGPGSSNYYLVPLESANDTEYKNYFAEGKFDVGQTAYLKIRDADLPNTTVIITDDPNLTVDIDDYLDKYYSYSTEFGIQYVCSPIWESRGITLIHSEASHGWIYEDESDEDGTQISVEYPSEMYSVYTNNFDEDSEEFKAFLLHANKPISISKWNGYEFFDGDGDMTLTVKYMIVPTDLEYTFDGGNSDGGNGNSGIAGTLITIIPVFVLLAILGSIAYMFVNRNETD